MTADASRATLILVDIQRGFEDPYWGARNNPSAESNALQLLAHWRSAGRPVIHVRHASRVEGSPLARHAPGFAFQVGFEPGKSELEIVKSENSAFVRTELEQHLRDARSQSVLLCGLTTPHCVSSTARMAANLGFVTFVASDACAAFARNLQSDWLQDGAMTDDPELSHRYALSHLHREFALVWPTRRFLPG